MGGDKSIVEGARVCFNTGGNNLADRKLIQMLIREKHNSPLEHCTMTFEVKLPLFVRDHWVRHRIGMSYNIKSLRYCEAEPEFFIPQELKIGSEEYKQWVTASESSINDYLTWVECFFKKGMSNLRSRELARTKLPTEIYTKMIVTMNAASLIHFLNLRDNAHAQPETQLYAKALLQLAKRVAPVTFTSYEMLKLKREI